VESAQAGGEGKRKGGVAGASAALQEIARVGLVDDGRAGIDIEINGDPDKPGVAYCWVKIHGDTTGDRDTIKKVFTDKGWTCKNTSKTDAKCTSP
jgi:hypothetical protein